MPPPPHKLVPSHNTRECYSNKDREKKKKPVNPVEEDKQEEEPEEQYPNDGIT